MAVNVHGDRSLYWKTGIDNSRLRQDAQKTKSTFQKLKGTLAKIGIFAGVYASLSKFKTEVIDFAKQVEHSMTEVRTISDEVDGAFDEYTQRVRQLATEVPDSAQKLSKGLYQVVSAGYDGAEGMRVLETSAKTAAAGMTDTATAASMITSTMNAYNMESEKAEEVADKLFGTVSGGMLTLEELSGQFGEVAATASNMNISLEESLAAIQTLTKQGMKTEQAATRTRSALEAIAEEYGTAWTESMTLQEKAIQIYEEAGGDLQKILEDVNGEAAGFITMIGGASETAMEGLEQIRDSAGDMEEAFGQAMESSVNRTNILVSNIRARLLPTGKALVDMWNSILRELNKVFESTDDHIDRLKEEAESYNTQRQEIGELVNTYDQLASKTNKTDEEKQRLKQTIKDISNIAPDLVSAWNSEGEAMDINREKASEYMEQLKALYKFKNREQIEVAKERLENLRAERDLIRSELEAGQKRISMGGTVSTITFGAEDIEKRRNQLKQYNQQIEEMQQTLKGLKGEFGGEGEGGTDLGQFGLSELDETLQSLQTTQEEEADTLEYLREPMEKVNTLYDDQNNVLLSIAENIKSLNEVGSDLNKAEQERIREQIKWWKELYTAIAEARRIGYEQWASRQAQQTLREMTGSGGLMPMQTGGGGEQETPESNLFKNIDELNTGMGEVNDMFYQLSDTARNLDTELGDLIASISDSLGAISGISKTISAAQGGASIGSLGGAMGVAGPWLSGFQALTTIGPKIQDLLHGFKSDFGEYTGNALQATRESIDIQSEQSDILKAINDSNRKLGERTLQLLRDQADRSGGHAERRRTPDSEPAEEEVVEQREPLRGAIRGMSEQTAGLLAGRMHSIQMHVVEHVEIANQSLESLRNIESNTLYNKKLYEFIKNNELEVRSVGG